MKKSKTKVVYKVFSLLLTVFMLNSLILIPSVSATQWNWFVTHFCSGGNATDTYLTNDGTSKKSTVRGFGGKGETDLSVRWEANSGSTAPFVNGGYVYLEYNNMLATGGDKVYVISLNVYPVQGLSKISIATNASVPIASDVPNAELNQRQWNRIACVYDRDMSTYGTCTLYINGNRYGTPFELSEYAYGLLTRDKINGRDAVTIRPLFWLAEGGDVYVDDVTVWRAARTAAYTGVPYVEGDFVFEDTIAPGITPAQIKAATVSGIKDYPNPVTVKAYRGGKIENNALLSEDTPLEEGDIVLLEEELYTGSDAAPDHIRMAYNYYRVTADDTIPVYDMEKDGHYQAVENGKGTTLDANVAGFYGKSADEKVMRISSTDAVANSSYLENNQKYHASGNHPLVFECDFLPEAHVRSVRFTTGASPASTTLYPGNNSARPENNTTSIHEQPAGFIHGRWYKLKMVVDFTKKTGTTYINGVKAGEFSLEGDLETTYERFKGEARFIVEWDDSTVDNPSDKKFCVDNFKVYEQKAPKPDEEAISLSKTANGYLLRGDEISFFGGEITDTVKTEMGVTDVKVFDSEKNYTPIAEGTALSDGNLIVMKNSAGTYGYYTAREHMLVAGGTGYVDDTTYTDGGLQFKATGGGAMIVAQYDNSGILINVQVQDLTGATPFVSLEPADGAAFVKTFIFNSMSGLAPYMPKMELRYKASPDLTIACWGDSLTYGQGSTDVNVNSYPAVLKKKQA